MKRPILFRCPTTGEMVQHILVEEIPSTSKDAYITFVCPWCARHHFVDPVTGKTAGER